MHVLDTNTFNHFHFGNAKVAEHSAGKDICITVVTRIEVLRGRFDFLLKAASEAEFIRAQDLLRQTDQMLAKIHIRYLDAHAVAHFMRLRQIKGLKKRGRADLLIASITLAFDATLVTRNLRDFSGIPNLKVVNWLD